MRMLHAAINDLARENVTPGEITAVHASLDALEQARDAFEARVSRLKAELRPTP